MSIRTLFKQLFYYVTARDPIRCFYYFAEILATSGHEVINPAFAIHAVELHRRGRYMCMCAYNGDTYEYSSKQGLDLYSYVSVRMYELKSAVRLYISPVVSLVDILAFIIAANIHHDC